MCFLSVFMLLSVFTLSYASSVVKGLGSLELCSDIFRASKDYNWLADIKPQYNLSTSSSTLSYLCVSVGEAGRSMSVPAILHSSITCTLVPHHPAQHHLHHGSSASANASISMVPCASGWETSDGQAHLRSSLVGNAVSQ